VDAPPPKSEPSPKVGDVPVGELPMSRGPSDRDDALTPLVPTGPPIRPLRRSRWRAVFAVMLAAIPLLCVGAIPLAFHSYDTATRPDRSAPDVVVHNYLQAFLVDRNDATTEQFVCTAPASLADFRAFRADLESREKRFGVTMSVSWGPLDVVPEGNDAASVTTDLFIQQSGSSNGVTSQGEQQETWNFRVVRAPDWRVCGATRTR
jgi:hypothetical protein